MADQKQSYPKAKAGTPPMGKEKSDTTNIGAKGGSNHMLTGMTAGPQKPGISSQEGASSAEFASGGGNKDVAPQHAGPQAPGCSSHETTGDGGKFAKGGSTHMFGKQTAKTASPA